ncbi:MAG: helix-turn-helix transcriptional regulator [Deltaproteobacteria bacterium]|nr:helix-turn-helix transcriptional regulator [Deltaproteobacteria bacterium]
MTRESRNASPSIREWGVSFRRVTIDEVEYAIVGFPIANPIEGDLSRAEKQIVELVMRGWSNGQIASARGTSARTIANQIARSYRKLGVGSRRELVARLAWSPSPLEAEGPPRGEP